MTRLYFHGNCQTRAMARMMREATGDLEVRDREVHAIRLPSQIEEFCNDIRWADVIVSQPISDDYRSEPRLSLRWLRENKRPDARLVVFPSLFFRAYTPQVFYLRPLSAVGMPYHDAFLVRAYADQRDGETVAAELADPDFVPRELIQRELESGLRDLRWREDQTCDVRASDILESGYRDALLFHTPNHPGREVLWQVLDRALGHAGVAERPDRTGIDYLGDLTIPPLPSAVAAFAMADGPAMAAPDTLTRFRLPGRKQTVSRPDYIGELWEHYAALGGPTELRSRLADESGMMMFLNRHLAARGQPPLVIEKRETTGQAKPRMKKKLGPPGKFVELPYAASEQEWRGGNDLRWEMIPATRRLAPAPIVDRNADLIYYFTKTHHKHQSGLWSYPTGTVSRVRGRSVAFVERAEGAVLDTKGFYYGSQWLDNKTAKLPANLMELVNRDIHVDVEALTRPPARLGEFIPCFDGNWRSYYHWLIDCVSRLFTLMKISDGKILMPAPPEALAPFHLDSVLRLGVPQDRLVWPDPERTLAKFHQLVWMNWNPTPWGGIGMLAELGAAYRASVGLGNGPGSRKIYVARKDSRRQVKQADEVEAVMRGLGFDVVVPDHLSFEDQVKTFGEASWIVGPHGAGLTNVLVAPPGCSVIEFMPDVLCRPAYWGMATSLQQRYGVMVVPGRSYFADLEVDPARVEAFITQLTAMG